MANGFASRAIAATALSVALSAQASAGPLTPDSRKAINELLELLALHEQVGETHYGELAAGKSLTIPLPADASVEYYVHAVGDGDAENIDLIAYDADGTEIDVDDAADNAPVLNIQASVHRSPIDKPQGIARPVAIELRMISCAAAVCGFGLRIDQME